MDYEKKLQLVRRGYVFHKLIDPKRIREIISLYRAKAAYLEIGANESQLEKLKNKTMTDEELDVDKKYKEGYNFGYRLSKMDDEFCSTVMKHLGSKKDLSEHDQGLKHGIEEARMEEIYKHKDAEQREQILKEETLKKTEEELKAIFDRKKGHGHSL